MAQVIRRVLAVFAIALWGVNGFAQSPAPAAGLAAEAAGDWAGALVVYRSVLETQPGDAALWIRVADIEARLGHADVSVTALERAAAAAPRDATLHQRLSQAYAIVDRPREALDAIERAVVLSPDSVEFLRAQATLATWVGDYHLAQDTYRRLNKLQPDDQDVWLRLARVSAWGGQTDAAVTAYRNYLLAEPGAAAVWIELAKTESWRGNYGAALDVLDSYQKRFGTDEAYEREAAAVLARAGRPARALEVLEPLLSGHPDDYELNLTRAAALTAQRRAREATEVLDTVRRLQPDARDTRSAEQAARIALASSADPGFTFYSDSSSLDVQRFAPRVTVSLATGATFAAGSEHERLTAARGSDLEEKDGTTDARHDQIWASAAQRFGAVTIRGRIGQARADGRERTTYAVGADLTPADGLRVSIERNAGFFVVSPRTIGLGLEQVSNRVQMDWSPTIRSQVVVDALYQTLSDGNQRWEFTASPRRSVARTEKLNLDLGFVVSRLHTTTNYGNGYYDPSRYEYYAASAYPYLKISERIGAGVSLALGTQRDDFSPSFRLGGSATAEATIGIYDPWVLKVNGGFMLNQRLGSGAFRGYGAGVSIIRRF